MASYVSVIIICTPNICLCFNIYCIHHIKLHYIHYMPFIKEIKQFIKAHCRVLHTVYIIWLMMIFYLINRVIKT